MSIDIIARGIAVQQQAAAQEVLVEATAQAVIAGQQATAAAISKNGADASAAAAAASKSGADTSAAAAALSQTAAQNQANAAAISASQAVAASLGLPLYPLINASTAAGGSNVLPQGITSGTVGGTAVSGATPGTYTLTASGGDFTGVTANLVVTSATVATIQIVNAGRTTVASPTAPTWAKPSAANLPSGTTLTANIGTTIAAGTGQYYLTSDAAGVNLLYWQNAGTGVPVAVLNGTGAQLSMATQAAYAALSALVADAPAATGILLAITGSSGRMVRGLIATDGTYDVGSTYIGAAGIKSGLLQVYDEPTIAGQDIYLADKHGIIRAILSQPATGSSGGGGTTPTVVQNQPNAIWRLRAKLQAGLDVNVLICSDSTGAGTGTWSYMQIDAMHAAFPTCSIVWHYWDNASVDNYGSPVTVYSGAGPTIHIWCAARYGTTIWYQMGSLFDVALGDGPFPNGASADWVIVNHGKNHANQASAPVDIIAASYLGPMQRLMSRHPYAGYSIFAQCPQRDDGSYAGQAEGIRIAATLLGWSLIDAYSLFLNAGKPSAWYADNVHPSTTGYQQIVDNLLTPLFTGQITQFIPVPPSLLDPAPNLLANGDFSAWTAGVPNNWSVIAGTVTQDTSNYETSGSAVTLTGNAATAQGLRQTLTGDILKRLRGRFLVASSRQYYPTGMTGGATGGAYGPNITYSTDGGSTWSADRRGVLIQYANGWPAAQGGWIWHCAATLIPASATHVRVETSGGSLGAGWQMNIDRMVLAVAQPRDMEL